MSSYLLTKRNNCNVVLSVIYLKRRTILRPRFTAIVKPGGRDVGMPQPLLDLGDVRLMVERVGGRRCAQGMSTNLEPQGG